LKSFSKLKKELDAGKVTGFYIFTGDEKEVLRKYIKRVDPNAKTLDTAEQLWAKISNKGLFNTGGTYVLHNNAEVQDIGVHKLIKMLGMNNLILVYDSIDKRRKFFKDADKYITEFKKFDDRQLISYIQNQVPELTSEMAFIIAKCSSNEIGRIENELDKLRFVDELNMDVLADLITPQVDDRIFEMIDSVASKNKDKAFDIYYDLLEIGEGPIKIISLLYMKFKQLFLVQNYYSLPENEIMSKTGLNYGQVKFTKKLVGKFSTGKILEILKEVQKTEVGVKTGQIDMELGTEDLILKIFQ